MATVNLLNPFDIGTLLLGDFSAAVVTATATTVTYTLDNRVIELTGAFTLASGVPTTGSIQALTYSIGGVGQFSLSNVVWPYAGFVEAVANDQLPALFAGSDVITGTTLADKIRGLDGDDRLVAGAGSDTLFGSYGNDTLDGGSDSDSMVGGSGDDVYRVDATGDRVTEYTGGGTDRVETTLTAYTLGAQVEDLTYLGTASFNGIGNELANQISGGAAADSLSGAEGDDTLRGGNGNDSLDGGAGNDWLIGDAGAASVTTTASRVSPSDPQLPISLSMTMAEVAASTSTTVSGYINNATLGAGNFNLAFVIDVSGSMAESFTGATVGDKNGDGSYNTKMDAAIASFESLVNSINAAGLGGAVRISLIPFESSSDIRVIGSGTSDTDSNGVADVVDAARALRASGGTSYDLGLQNAVNFFNASPAGNNFVFFLSDGAPNGGAYDAYLNTLRADAGINANIRALGIEAGTAGYYDVLDLLDNARLDDSAINVADPAGLTAGLVNSQVNLADISRLEIYKNGALVTALGPEALTQTPFGLKYSYIVSGLSTTGADQIETRLVLTDPQATFVSTNQVITVGTLASNDSLVGGAGNDTLDGGAGIDTLVGGVGDDVYRVDSATDVIVEAAGAGYDRVESSVGISLYSTALANIEELVLTGSGALWGTGNGLANRIEGNIGNNTLQGMGGNDTLIGGYGIDTVSYTAATTGVTVNLATGVATAGAEIDTLSGFENVRGSSYGDSLTGDAGANDFFGMAGNDSINGAGGFDRVSYAGTASAVTVVFSTSYSGSATSASEGTDALSYIEGVIGSDYADSISDAYAYSGALDNKFLGGAGNDTLNGGFGSDTLIGGLGDDVMSGGADYSTYATYQDVVDYSGNTAAIAGSLVGTMTSTASGVDTLSGFERIIATGYADSITGGAAAEYFEGRAGDDTISGGDGNDVIDGGGGIDSMLGGLGNDTYYVNMAADVVVENAGEGTDTVLSSTTYSLSDVDVENLTLQGLSALNGYGNASANILIGNTAANALYGYSGNDSIDGGAGDDTVSGGEGSDTLLGGAGVDVLTFAGSASQVSGALNGSSTSSFVTLSGTDVVSGFENLIGSSYDDILGGDSAANKIDGGAGNDSITGGYGNDSIWGGTGNDTIDGGYGVDSVSYAYFSTTGINADLSTGVVVGDGTDMLVVGTVEEIIGTGLADTIAWKSSATTTSTNFYLVGGGGADSLQGSNGADTLDGGTGVDTMSGGNGYDLYMVDAGGDVVSETSTSGGIDTVQASVSYTLAVGSNIENLTLMGTAWAATGNEQNNLLTGNASGNVLTGGVGYDTLNGGLGRDVLDGGLDAQADYFVFGSVADSSAVAGDKIVNFNEAYDYIMLNGIDANATANYDQAFSFIGTAGFTGVAGQLRYSTNATDTYVFGDVDGDKVADLMIQITGVHLLTSSDFYL
jgi:Ca2+-binding RTX toxin-like protein